MSSIDLSDGQKTIVKDLVKIYQKSLTGIMDDIHNDTLMPNLKDTLELVESIGGNKNQMMTSFEEEFFKYCDAASDPNSVFTFGIMDLIIIKFILINWYKEEKTGWNDLDVANLLIKMDFLIDNVKN